MRIIRDILERPDAVTASAVSARDEIGRAIASRIKQIESSGNLKKIVEEVLPEIEKFLESPEEKRLRRIRNGVATALTGLGIAAMFIIVGLTLEEHLFFITGAGLLLFLIGLGLILNGALFTIPHKHLGYASGLAKRHTLEALPDINEVSAKGLASAESFSPAPSVTENTTRQLAIVRDVSEHPNGQ